ncbi:MAG: methyltransferase domain-containing protein [Ferruginibacter sp.]
MIKRLIGFVKREKLKHPGKPGVLLIYQRCLVIAKEKIAKKVMELKRDSTFTAQEHMFMCSLFPKKMLDIIISELKPTSILDVGCGTGVSLQYFIQNGIDSRGVENSEIAISNSPVKDKITKHDLRKELDLKKKFDLVWSFEVIEHIHPQYEQSFLNTLTKHAPVVILSAAQPGQGGHGHFNEQEPAYWKKRFKDLGFVYDAEFTQLLKDSEDILSENILCFRQVKG